MARPLPVQPWQRKRQYSSSGSGFVAEGRRLLTNAHWCAPVQPIGSGHCLGREAAPRVQHAQSWRYSACPGPAAGRPPAAPPLPTACCSCCACCACCAAWTTTPRSRSSGAAATPNTWRRHGWLACCFLVPGAAPASALYCGLLAVLLAAAPCLCCCSLLQQSFAAPASRWAAGEPPGPPAATSAEQLDAARAAGARGRGC